MARKKKAAVAEPATNEAPKPNLEFIGKVPVRKFVETESGKTIALPADQSAPFFHEKAVLIAQRLPNYYKTYDCGNCGK